MTHRKRISGKSDKVYILEAFWKSLNQFKFNQEGGHHSEKISNGEIKPNLTVKHSKYHSKVSSFGSFRLWNLQKDDEFGWNRDFVSHSDK